MKGLARRTAAVVWPAFLVAGVLEMAVFAFVDPQSLHTLGGSELGLSDTTIYSVAFFVFWGATAVACALTLMLQRAAADVNSRSWAD